MRPCLVSFHAHPDDEAIFTGGTIVRAVRSGWRVVLVIATSGELGVAPDWVEGDLARVRRTEAESSAGVLGIERVEFLGYRDSGVGSSERAARPMEKLADSSVLDAAARLGRILHEEHAAVLTSYDGWGIYGHPDHIRVHEIATNAVLGTMCDLVEATVSRATLRAVRERLIRRGLAPEMWPAPLADRVGVEATPELVTVDVSAQLPVKLRAIAAHASQVIEAPSFMGLPPGAFHHLLGVESFRQRRTVDGRFAALVGTSAR